MLVPPLLRRLFARGPKVAPGTPIPTARRRGPVARRKPEEEPVAKPLLVVSASRLECHPSAVCEEVRRKLSAIGYLEHLQLARIQRTAWLVVTYDTIVRTEGHKRFFRMYGVGCAAEALEALTEIGAEAAAPFLNEAIRRDFAYLDDNETAIGGIGFPSSRLGSPPKYFDVDSSYRELAPSIQTLLERYVLAHKSDFVSIESAA